MSLFDGGMPLKLTKPVRLIELFAGIGAQAKALESLGVEFERYRICEIEKSVVDSYNAVHGTFFVPTDIMKLHAEDLGVVDTDKYDYILTYPFLVPIYQRLENKRAWAREAERVADYYGKWNGCSTKCRYCLKFCLWKTSQTY